MSLLLATLRNKFRGIELLGVAFALVVLNLYPQVTFAVDNVHHTVSFPSDKEQLFLVRSEFPVNASVTELIMPNWTPGSYLIRDYAANINRISAVSQDGTTVALQKISKDRWRADTSRLEKLLVEYEVFTPTINVSTSWASREFSLINGASVFLYTQETRGLPQLLSIASETTRGEVFTAMRSRVDGDGYEAENYDVLVDNPVAVARAPTRRFSHENQDYVLLNVGENAFWDGQQAMQDTQKIVKETQTFWDSNPLERPFWFMNFIIEGKGGLEHDHSTVIMTSRRQMSNRDDYIKWLGTVAHEFFHVWNVRHMRPVELGQYDYQQEQYTSQLWVAEGLTSYYDNLILSRAGLITPAEYMKLLAKDIYRLETTPGRLMRPVTEASLDAWIRHYRPNANSINSTISYYTKGAVIGFVLDTHIRRTSKGRRNLDDVMRKMYELYAREPYSSDDFEKAVVEVGGVEAGLLLQSLLTTTVDPDVDSALDYYGLELNRGAILVTGETGESPLPSDLGVLWEDGEPGRVQAVINGSGGATAGLIPADEILAIGGERLTMDNLESLMISFSPGEETTLLISRRGKIIKLDIKLDIAAPDRFDIVLQSGFGKRDVSRLTSLLGQDISK